MEKSPDAFRTISEVSEALDTPAHVLRFWETRFTQVRPVKRAGGRRYYRPSDVALLAGIKKLLHDDGMTIRGVQKLLREQGIRHVAALAAPPGDAEGEMIESAPVAEAPMLVDVPQEAETAPQDNVVPLAARKADAPGGAPEGTVQSQTPAPTDDASPETREEPPVEAFPDAEAESPAGSPPEPQGDLFAPEPAPTGAAPDWPSHPLTRAEATALTGPQAEAEVEQAPLASRLRNLPRRAAPAHAGELAALRDRLAALRDSLAARAGRARH